MVECLTLLSPGSPFVIYHEYLEPLESCYMYLSTKEIGIRLILSDTWFREYQVLPGRTHPVMHTSGSGGYILSGIYVGTNIYSLTIHNS